MIEHAKACHRDDDKRYIYHCFIAEKSISLVFNCIYEVVEVSFNGKISCSLETLNLEEKVRVYILFQMLAPIAVNSFFFCWRELYYCLI